MKFTSRDLLLKTLQISRSVERSFKPWTLTKLMTMRGLFSPSFMFSHSHWKLRISDSVALRIHMSITAPHPPFLIWVKTGASLKGSEKGGGIGESSEFGTDDEAGQSRAAFFWPKGVFSHFLIPVWTVAHENAVVRGDNLWSYLDLPYISFNVFRLFFPPLSSTFFSNLSETNSISNISHSSFLRHLFQDFTKGHPFHTVFFNLKCLPTVMFGSQTGGKTPDRRLKD